MGGGKCIRLKLSCPKCCATIAHSSLMFLSLAKPKGSVGLVGACNELILCGGEALMKSQELGVGIKTQR